MGSLPSEPEKIYKLLYHNDEFLQSIWKEEGFKGAFFLFHSARDH